MWTTGRIVLGLTDDQFYALTPRQFHLLLDRKLDEIRHREYLTGLMAATVANFSLGAPKEPVRPRDFALPLLQDLKERKPRLNRKKIAADIRAQFNAALRRQAGMLPKEREDRA